MPDSPQVKLHKAGNYWQASWYDAGGKRRRRGLGSRDKVSERDALLACAKIENELAERGESSRSKPTVGYICDDWYADRVGGLQRKATRRMYTIMLNTVRDHFNVKAKASSITPEQCVAFRNKLLEKYADNTAAKRFMVARSVFERARRQRFILDNPFDLVTRPPGNVKKEHVYVPFDERFTDMLKREPRVDIRAYAATLRLSGMRRAEPMRMRWEHVDFDRRRLIVPGPEDGRISGKKKRREIPMAPELEPYLLELLDASPEGSTHPFATVNADSCYESLKRMQARAAYPIEFTPQSLRVSRENDWMQVYPQAEVAAWLGHSTLTQMQYYHQSLSPASQRTMDLAATTPATISEAGSEKKSEKPA